MDPDKEFDANESSDEEHVEHDARAHYTDMGASTMRRKAHLSEDAALAGPKYAGVKASRQELFGDEEEGGKESDDDEDDEEGDEEEDEEPESDNVEDEGGESGEDDDDDVDDVDDDEVDDDDVDDSEEADDNGDKGDKVLGAKPPQPDESQTLLEQVHTTQEKDAKKGRDVRKQIKAWEQALRMRIAMQKLVTAASRLPAPTDYDEYEDEAPNASASLRESADTLDRLASELLEARVALWKSNVSALSSLDARGTPERAAASLEEQVTPFRRTLLTRWSSKIAAAPSGGAAARLQLKAMNQGAVEQIDQALAGDGLSRLVDRTRVWRGDEPRLSGDDESHPEVFDDSDFYSSLLRDLLDNAGLVEAGASATASSALSRKRKRAVDTRASKGRRIRYDVMERVQNFMPPVPSNLWDDAQSVRLFAQLAGSDEAAKPAAEEPAAETADGFRLFA